MSKLYAVAISQYDQAIELQILEAKNKIDALWEHDAVDPDYASDQNSLISQLVRADDGCQGYKGIRNELAELGVLVAVTKICD